MYDALVSRFSNSHPPARNLTARMNLLARSGVLH